MSLHGRRIPEVLLATCLCFSASACDGPPGPAATETEVSGLQRYYHDAPRPLGFRVSYLRHGDPMGRRVIFIHGTPGSADDWSDLLLKVPAGFDYVAVDRPGFGSSGPQGSVTSLEEQASALAPLLVRRQGQLPILVGHSLGGPIAAQIAADNPDKVGALVILAGSLDPGLEQIHWAQPLGEWVGLRSLLPRAMRNANQELMALKPHLEALAPRLRTLTCPVVIVHGTADKHVPYANVPFMQRMMTGTRPQVITLENRDHFLPWKEADEVRRAIARAAETEDVPC